MLVMQLNVYLKKLFKMDIYFDININGEISSEQLNAVMEVLGNLIIQEIQKQIRKMDLISKGKGAGQLLQNWTSSWDGKKLYIENKEKYSDYLEFGTYAYWQMNGLENFTDPMHPKKKDMSLMERKAYPKGMQSFAPIRKVLYNDNLMSKLVQTAFSSQL